MAHLIASPAFSIAVANVVVPHTDDAVRRHAGQRRLCLRDRPNPVAPTAEVVGAGRAHFADHSASCHANDGGGNTDIGRNLFPKAPDMRQPATQDLRDGELFWIIENGTRFTGMPAWSTGTKEGEDASWHLVHFIRRLPQLTPDEIAEMEALNPRPPQEIRDALENERFLQGTEPAPSTVHEH
jgi:mono/diheme cytochrome c family protein